MPVRRPRRRILLNAPVAWDLLDRLNLSQNRLADPLGCSSSHVSRLFNGARCPSPAMRQRLQEVLGAGFDELFIVEELIVEELDE